MLSVLHEEVEETKEIISKEKRFLQESSLLRIPILYWIWNLGKHLLLLGIHRKSTSLDAGSSCRVPSVNSKDEQKEGLHFLT